MPTARITLKGPAAEVEAEKAVQEAKFETVKAAE